MKTRRITITAMIALLVLFFAIPAQAQDKEEVEKMHKNRQEEYARIKSAKIAFITEHVDLTPEEAQKFWPVYNEMENKREELTRHLMKRFKGDKEKGEMTNEQAEKMMQSQFSQEQALLDLKKEYHIKYTEILPATKVAKLYEAENKFRQMLMERLKHNNREKRTDEERRLDEERRKEGERRRAPEGDERKAPDQEKIESN